MLFSNSLEELDKQPLYGKCEMGIRIWSVGTPLYLHLIGEWRHEWEVSQWINKTHLQVVDLSNN